MDQIHHRPYFFENGIRFECRKCGRCCTGEPGTVHVNDRETVRIATFLQLSTARFTRKYLRPFNGGTTIAEDDQGRCLFYESGCRIYPVRPFQCRTFPFWFENLRSEFRWRETEKACPGIGRGGLFSKEAILTLARQSMAAPDLVSR